MNVLEANCNEPQANHSDPNLDSDEPYVTTRMAWCSYYGDVDFPLYIYAPVRFSLVC
jgi:hypothetical protein